MKVIWLEGWDGTSRSLNLSARSRWCSSAAGRRSSEAWVGPTAVNLLGIASAFGFAIVAMARGIGPISGCHVYPAVSFSVYVVGRLALRSCYQGRSIAQG
jgi:glycerol uptake facilitator-like aquaporin